MTGIARAPLAAVLALCLVGPTLARGDATTESRLRDALRSAQSQLRALEDERARWEQSEATLKKELEATKAELSAAPKKAGPSDRALAHLRARLTEAEEAVATLRGSLSTCERGSKEVADAARTSDAERSRLKAEVTSLEGSLAGSKAKNGKMYELAKEILDWVERSGARGGSEPVLGLKRVELENIAQDYQDKLIERKVHP